MSDPIADTVAAYIRQLSPMEKKVLEIATTHLETSFNLVKSIGFLEWQALMKSQSTTLTSEC